MSRSLSCTVLVVGAAGLALAGAASGQLVFQPPLNSTAVEYARGVAIGDVNEDGQLDAITSSLFVGPQPLLTLGLGNGSFGSPVTLTMFPGGAGVVRLVDFDHDGHLDALLGTGLDGVGSIAVAPGDGRGGFGAMVAINVDTTLASSADVGDFNGDGELDVAIFNGPSWVAPGSIVAVFGHGDGSFDAPLVVASMTQEELDGIGMLIVGDTDGDGFDDLILSSSYANGVLRSLGDGRFVPVPCSGSCDHPLGGVVTDLNADGRADVVTNTKLLLGQPDGSLAVSQNLPLTALPYGEAVGDFDGDGLLDVVVGRPMNAIYPSTVLFLRGHGDGTVQTTGLQTGPVPGDLGTMAVADFNGDGRADLAAVAATNQQHMARLSVLLNATYEPGSPFLDLGGNTVSLSGSPIQIASGTLAAGTPFSFKLFNGPAGGVAFHVVGFAALNAPFKSGTMVPSPALINGPFAVNSSGQLNLAGNWPAGGSGVALYLQYWCKSAPGFPPVLLSASTGVRAQIP